MYLHVTQNECKFCALQLYSDFAEAFDLSECKIAVIHCAGYYDPTLVESLWQDVIDKGNSHFEI